METYLKKKKNCLIIFRNGQDKVLKRGNGNFVKTNAWKLVSREIIEFLEPTKDWSKYNEDLNNELFWTDHLHLSKFGNKKFASSIFTLLQQYKIVSTYPKLVPASSVVCKCFIYLSVSVKLIHHVTLLLTSPLLRMENIPHRVIM